MDKFENKTGEAVEDSQQYNVQPQEDPSTSSKDTQEQGKPSEEKKPDDANVESQKPGSSTSKDSVEQGKGGGDEEANVEAQKESSSSSTDRVEQGKGSGEEKPTDEATDESQRGDSTAAREEASQEDVGIHVDVVEHREEPRAETSSAAEIKDGGKKSADVIDLTREIDSDSDQDSADATSTQEAKRRKIDSSEAERTPVKFLFIKDAGSPGQGGGEEDDDTGDTC